MFDLEPAIAQWRKQMLGAGIKTPVPLEELENHLREEIERLIKSGLSDQCAFDISISQIGRPEHLKREFKKTEKWFMNKKLMILVGVLAVLVGTAMILPALHLYVEQGSMVHNAAVGFLFGIPVTLLGMGTAVYGYTKRKA